MYTLNMHNLVIQLAIAQGLNSLPAPTDVLPPPGMYAIYRNGVGSPSYMWIPDDDQRSAGLRVRLLDQYQLDKLADSIGVTRPAPTVIPDTPLGTPAQLTDPTKQDGNGPTFLQRIGRGLRAAGQSLAPTGGYSVSAPIQATPMIPPAPMQFTPMQRPITVSPGVNLMNGPTYTIFP